MQFCTKSLCLISGLLFPVFSPAQDFPEGAGRDQILFACTACHGLENITAPHKKLTTEEWEVYLYDMVAKGANLTVDEIEPVRRYLIENYVGFLTDSVFVSD